VFDGFHLLINNKIILFIYKTTSNLNLIYLLPAESDLLTFAQRKQHFETDKSFQQELFTGDSRPLSVRQLYTEAGKELPVASWSHCDGPRLLGPLPVAHPVPLHLVQRRGAVQRSRSPATKWIRRHGGSSNVRVGLWQCQSQAAHAHRCRDRNPFGEYSLVSRVNWLPTM